MSSPEHKAYIWNLIKNIEVGMLVTQDEDASTIRSRPMHLVQDAYDGTLYFFTPKSDAKVYEIRDERDVCITFSDIQKQIYISLSGQASLSTDRELIDKYWNSWVAQWFEGGKDDPEVSVLAIKIHKGEHWNAENNKAIQFIKMAKAKAMDETPDLVENKSFG